MSSFLRWKPFSQILDGPKIPRQITWSPGGLVSDLQSRVLDGAGDAISGLCCVGEAAGFGNGGACGKCSLEGAFLPGRVLTARTAARDVTGKI
ncbi:FAD-binding protein [Paraburkholderia dinghuensis]|uniref:FAD-binding protein n=1 Tax=Paraburkholderia dinghuensis TaxID=2305225 RepID=A0A3N6P140_9BURK|nr:FAD-binding protein [Paraburkholderia dinghuensis]